VPEQDIRRRYARSLRRFVGTYRTLADNWVVMFNGEASFETVAVGAGTEVAALYHEALWQQLQALAAGGDPDDED
jgi:predicted ABC-type ATPase